MKITVNGKEYESWDDVPEDVRKLVGSALPDTDSDGVPDLLEGGHGPLPSGSTTVTSETTSVTVDGKTYGSIDELPADLRTTLARAGLLGAAHHPNLPPPAVGPIGAAPTAAKPQLGPGQVLLNGEVVNVDSAPKRKRWWNRG